MSEATRLDQTGQHLPTMLGVGGHHPDDSGEDHWRFSSGSRVLRFIFLSDSPKYSMEHGLEGQESKGKETGRWL